MSYGMSRREFGKTLGALSMGGALPAFGRSELPGDSLGGGQGRSGETPFDIEGVRRDTPGCAKVSHFNNAGAALPPRPVLDAVIGHLHEEAEIGGYEAADAAEAARGHTYEALGRLLNCSVDEIALVENATRGWDMAFYSLRFNPGDRILTSAAEYASNYIAYLQVAKRTGAVVEIVPDDEYGQVSVGAMKEALAKGGVALVGLTHTPTNGGLVNPAEEVGRLTREAGVPYLLDACQTAGQWPLDVDAIGCDMLSGTGRKFLRGPRGTGFLYVRKSMINKLEPPLLDLHAAKWVELDRYEIVPTAKRFENWEQYVAGHIGLGVAVDYALGLGVDAIRQRVTYLAGRLRDSLSELPGVTVRDLGRNKCGIVTFTVEGEDPTALRDELRERHINVSVTSRSSTRIDMESRGLQSMVRSSVHYYNTGEEIERLVTAVGELSQKS
jgi:selenocysteine lyase/cysteine desulfurase